MSETSHIEHSSFIEAPLDKLWSIGATPAGLVELTPKIFGLVLQEPGEIRLGCRLHLGLKIPGTGQRLDWIAHVTECNETALRRHFVDVQEEGPFRSYRHQHIFEAGEGGTWVRDVIDFVPPFWSPMAFARLSLKQLVEGRHESLKRRALAALK
jgi:ligand-binding SRPBCC domain-containing protein